MIKVTSLNEPELAVYKNRNESQLKHMNEPREGIFIAESPNVILRALEAGMKPVSYLIEETQIKNAYEKKVITDEEVPVYVGDHKVLTQIIGYEMARGMLCAFERKELSKPEDICKGANKIVVMDDIENPANIGAIFRSAAALNMDGILLTKGCSDPLYRRAARVSMGAVFMIPWTYISREDYVEILRELGYFTVALALSPDSFSVSDPLFKRKNRIAVVLGNESDGLSSEIVNKADAVAMIPMSNGVDSLNVAMAGTVAFWEFGGKK